VIDEGARSPGDSEVESLRARLREKDRMLATLIGNLRGMVYRCRDDEHWTMEFVSDGCPELTGYEADELLLNGRVSYEALTFEADRSRVRERIRNALRDGRRFSVEYRIVCRDGTLKWVWETGIGVEGEGGARGRIEGFIQDISERKQAEESLQEAERRYRSIFENATEGIFQTSAEGRYLAVNPALARIYGYEAPEQLITSLSNIGAQLYVQPARREEFMRLARERGAVQGFISQVYRRNGDVIWIAENARAAFDADGAFSHFEGTVIDVSESRNYEEQLRYQASHDALTLLPNRALLHDRLTQAIAHARRYGGVVGVAFVDLDNFKMVNDTLGHDTGDALLKTMAERMSSCLRQSDTVARQGGDEFVLVLAGEPDVETLTATLERTRVCVAAPWSRQGRELHVTCSVGAAVFPRDGTDAVTLLKNADIAMYRAKNAGRNALRFFQWEMVQAAVHRLDTEQSLRRALKREEFEVHYQPRLDLATGALTGMEALLRWRRRDGELVLPERLIPVAEETGLIVPIGEAVMRAACLFNRELARRDGRPRLTVAVNLSLRQLHHPDFAGSVRRILEETGLEAGQLELEITESLVMHDVEHFVSMFEALDALGVHLSVDDFGTGYSSLSYLKRLPVDRLKIDRSFVRDITTDSDDAAIVRAVISLGHNLGIRVVAEGVENDEQLQFLRANHCDEGQGYHFGRPVRADRFVAEYEQPTAVAADGIR
jgi:diguanylate cyclase (GGDEF)-like protein/PAS domain S-box-containing protein